MITFLNTERGGGAARHSAPSPASPPFTPKVHRPPRASPSTVDPGHHRPSRLVRSRASAIARSSTSRTIQRRTPFSLYPRLHGVAPRHRATTSTWFAPAARVSNPSAVLLDTGEALKVETISGAELKKRDGSTPASPVTRHDAGRRHQLSGGEAGPVECACESPRPTRIPNRYGLDGDELVWDRAFGRAAQHRGAARRAGRWWRARCPAPITQDADGRQRLYFENNRNDEIQVLIRARRFCRG